MSEQNSNYSTVFEIKNETPRDISYDRFGLL
jgi:hypothetical protein